MKVNDIASLVEIVTAAANEPQDYRPEYLRKLKDYFYARNYYRFLFELTRRLEPKLVLELGTHMGGSTLHFAAGYDHTIVISVDINPGLASQERITVLRGDSVELSAEAVRSGKPEIVFFDTSHTYQQTRAEYEMYRPLAASPAVLLFDDVDINDDMRRFWLELEEEFKLSLPHLHYTGFGAVVKR